MNVLKDLGMTLSKQLELGNNSQVIFQQTTQDFGMCTKRKTVFMFKSRKIGTNLALCMNDFNP